MPDEQDERRVYSLSDEHDEWADLEDLVPEKPRIPDSLCPVFPDGDTVDEVGELTIYAHGDEAPYFPEGGESVEATPQEVAEWRATWASVEQAQQALRARLHEAAEEYERVAKEALADLAKAMEPWAPVEATLKGRSLELAAKLHEHRTAAKEWEAAQEAKEQEHLDTIHGPRTLVLYKPESLSSRRQSDHIARVHLTTCGRRAKKGGGGFLPTGWDNDEGLRANDAWQRLTHPDEWIRGTWGDISKNMRVKFCSFCKPWTVFQEHLDEVPFPRPRYDSRMNAWVGEVRLTDVPDAWAASSPKES
jgi:hypothetical protein